MVMLAQPDAEEEHGYPLLTAAMERKQSQAKAA